MVKTKIKWGKEILEIDIDPAAGVSTLKAQIFSATQVPPDRQKISGVKGGQLKDDAVLEQVFQPGKPLMLIGTADPISTSAQPDKPIVFAEDAPKAGHGEDSVLTNGIENIGNTCYMASGIQTLRVIPELRPALEGPEVKPLAKALGTTFKNLDSTKQAITPLLFHMQLTAAYPMFGETDDRGHPRQQDAQECLSKIIDHVGTVQATSSTKVPSATPAESATAVDPDAAPAAAEKPATTSSPLELFRGYQRSTVVCNEEPSEGHVDSLPFTMLQCNIASHDVQTLEAGLAKNLIETFEGKSEKTGKPSTFTRTNTIAQLPQYLFIQMARFTWKGDTKSKAKLLKPIQFPMVLDVYNLCTEELQAELGPARVMVKEARDNEVQKRKDAKSKAHVIAAKEGKGGEAAEEDTSVEDEAKKLSEKPNPPISGNYELCAVISHKGRDADGGHYVAWVKKKDNWLVCDDGNVGMVSEEDVKRLAGTGEAHIAYILLYRAFNPETKQLPLLL